MATFKLIKDLCYNFDDLLSESELISTLKAIQIDPGVLSERNEYGRTLLFMAAESGRSPDFCQVLHELDATLVRTQEKYGWLPVHCACDNGSVETAKYLLEIYSSIGEK